MVMASESCHWTSGSPTEGRDHQVRVSELFSRKLLAVTVADSQVGPDDCHTWLLVVQKPGHLRLRQRAGSLWDSDSSRGSDSLLALVASGSYKSGFIPVTFQCSGLLDGENSNRRGGGNWDEGTVGSNAPHSLNLVFSVWKKKIFSCQSCWAVSISCFALASSVSQWFPLWWERGSSTSSPSYLFFFLRCPGCLCFSLWV